MLGMRFPDLNLVRRRRILRASPTSPICLQGIEGWQQGTCSYQSWYRWVQCQEDWFRQRNGEQTDSSLYSSYCLCSP